MSFAFIVMTMLLGSSLVVAFVLQPSREEPANSANFPVPHHRCHGESLESIRKGLLRALNLPAEPQLPVGGLDAVRKQWKRILSTISHGAKGTAGPIPAISVSPDDGNSTNQKCCSMAYEISINDLGWDNWVIHPSSLTIVQCAVWKPELNTVQCLSSHTFVPDADSQVQAPCCRPSTQEMVPVIYADEYSGLVISSIQLTRSCGCGPGNIQQ